jgi:hypothetical protein
MAAKSTAKSTRKTTGKSTAKSTGKSTGKSKGRTSGKRELIDTGTDKRFVRRAAGGQFKESDDVGKSLAADRRKRAKTATKSGQGDRGDRKVSRKR